MPAVNASVQSMPVLDRPKINCAPAPIKRPKRIIPMISTEAAYPFSVHVRYDVGKPIVWSEYGRRPKMLR